MNSKVDYFMDVYFCELTLGVTDAEELKRIFRSMDSRKLLTFIYILKAVLKALRNYVRSNFDKVLRIIMLITEMLEAPVEENAKDAEIDGEMQGEVEGSEQEDSGEGEPKTN
jgi:vacuolar-type H+-ATPase subunit F/Vma7